MIHTDSDDTLLEVSNCTYSAQKAVLWRVTMDRLECMISVDVAFSMKSILKLDACMHGFVMHIALHDLKELITMQHECISIKPDDV